MAGPAGFARESSRAGAAQLRTLTAAPTTSSMNDLLGECGSKPGSGDRLWIASFAIDGELLGVGERAFEKLSQHWIGVCASLIDHYGPVFDRPLQGPLSHLRITCTAAASAAMVVLYAHGLPVSSFAVAADAAPAEDTQVLAMFAESIRSSTVQFQVSNIETPFHEMTTISQRPLMVVVPWPESSIAEQDHELAKELGWHLAAALVRKLRE